MARWKLMTPHYLKVPGEKWEYTENDRTTGRPKRIQFEVPRLLDPRDSSNWTRRWGRADNEDGEIVVCHKGKGEESDIEFIGDPSPDMVPVDDEAKEISAKFEKRWDAKPENMAGDFSQSLVDRFQNEMAEIKAKPPEIPGMADLISAMKSMAESNQKVLETVTATRRV